MHLKYVWPWGKADLPNETMRNWSYYLIDLLKYSSTYPLIFDLWMVFKVLRNYTGMITQNMAQCKQIKSEIQAIHYYAAGLNIVVRYSV